mgnify:CR=1 FL=1
MILFCISLFFPLLSFIVAGIFSHSSKNLFIGLLCSLLMIVSATASLMLTASLSVDEPLNLTLKEFINLGSLDLSFSFYLDAISLVMLSTVGVVASIVHIYSIGYMRDDASFNRFFSYLGLFVFCMNVLVSSDNFIGLFIGWEGVGLCSWLLIGFWYKRPSANVAANEAFVMNRVADLAMLVGIFYIFYSFGSLKFSEVFNARSDLSGLNLGVIATLLFIGAMGKSAQFPFHTWLPLTYTQAPFLGSMFLAAMMSKMGIYGFLRFCLPMFSAASAYFANFICVLALIMIIYASFIAFKKTNAKEIIAYSSAAHMSVIVLGVFSFNQIGLSGAVFMMLSHALISGGLFIGVGFLERKSANLDIFKFGSLSRKMPLFALFFAVMMLGLIGLPLTAGFVGEFLCLAGIYALNPWFALVGGCGIIMSAIYALRMFSAMFSGESSTLQISDIRGGEILALAPIVVLIIVLGVAPNLVLEQINESTQNLVEMMKFNDEALAKEAR